MLSSQVFNLDSFAAIKNMPDKCFSLLICDPVYGIQGNSHRKNQSRGKVCKSKTYHDAIWDQEVPSKEFFHELIRVSENQIIFGANHFIEKIPYNSSCWIVWDKVNDGTNFADCELAWTSFKTSVRRFRFQWSGMLQGNMKTKEIRIHGCQKPVKLYSWLIKNYSEPGGEILDPFLGSGSSRIAAYDAGINFTGYEIDPIYFRDQELRFKNHLNAPKLPFDYKPVFTKISGTLL